MFSRNRIAMLGGIAVLIALFVWYSFLRTPPSDSLIQSEDLTGSNAVDADVVQTLLTLRAVSLSGTIFSDAAFKKLQDFGSEIVQEPAGRPNPFAPLTFTQQSQAPIQFPIGPSGGSSSKTATTTPVKK